MLKPYELWCDEISADQVNVLWTRRGHCFIYLSVFGERTVEESIIDFDDVRRCPSSYNRRLQQSLAEPTDLFRPIMMGWSIATDGEPDILDRVKADLEVVETLESDRLGTDICRPSLDCSFSIIHQSLLMAIEKRLKK